VTLTISTLAAFQVIADAGNSSKFTNVMTSSAFVASGEFCVTNASSSATGVFAQDSEQIMFMPPCSISLLKEVACQTPGTFSSSLTAVRGASLIYRFTVTNSGADILSNIKINDNKLPGSPFTVPGTLNPGASTSITVNATAPNTAGPFTNTATATANCQFAATSVTSNQSSATVNVVDPTLSCDKTVNGVKNVVDYVFGSTLTYRLAATNTSAGAGATNLNLTLSDPILSGLPGISCKRDDTNAPVTLPFTFTSVPPGATRSVTCTVSFANEAAFRAASGGGDTLTNTLTVNGVLSDNSICAVGVQGQLTCSSQARVSITPPPPPQNEFCIIRTCDGPACRGSDPGQSPPDNSPVNDQKAGSILFYNFYSSSTANPNAENTRFNITNTAQGTVFVHLFFVDGSNCSVADSFICLSPNQTLAILSSDVDPGVTGYMVAVAVDDRGCPIKWNYLIGDEYIKLSSGFAANLGAEAFSAIVDDPAGCTAASSSVPLRFDGVSYSSAPRVLAVDNIGSNLDGNTTRLIINRVGGDLSSTAGAIGPMFGLLFDDLEKPLSFTFRSAACQTIQTLSTTFPRTTPRIDTVIPAGRSGWMKLSSTDGNGLLGAVLVSNPGAVNSATAYFQGHNMHKLTLGGNATYQMPVFPPKG
jgi:hypothetical protein